MIARVTQFAVLVSLPFQLDPWTRFFFVLFFFAASKEDVYYMPVVNSGCTATYVKVNEDCRRGGSPSSEDLFGKTLPEVGRQDTVVFPGCRYARKSVRRGVREGALPAALLRNHMRQSSVSIPRLRLKISAIEENWNTKKFCQQSVFFPKNLCYCICSLPLLTMLYLFVYMSKLYIYIFFLHSSTRPGEVQPFCFSGYLF